MDELTSLRPPPLLDAILEGTKTLGFSMVSEPRTGAMLRVLASSKPGGRFLELGSGTGISTAWLLDGMSIKARLTTVDNHARVQSVARNILGHDPRLEIVTADGGFLAAPNGGIL
jgi:predicted O-methyltransferase YrrM